MPMFFAMHYVDDAFDTKASSTRGSAVLGLWVYTLDEHEFTLSS